MLNDNCCQLCGSQCGAGNHIMSLSRKQDYVEYSNERKPISEIAQFMFHKLRQIGDVRDALLIGDIEGIRDTLRNCEARIMNEWATLHRSRLQ